MGLEGLSRQELTFKPVTISEWSDLESLFEEQAGPQQGCWCMYWRIRRSECQKQFGEGNKQALKEIVESGRVPGILAYDGGRPIGWCSVAPREEFPVLDRSPTLKRVDDQPVWSIVCFFVSKPQRRKGLTNTLLQAAIEYAREHGARIIEAYPLITENTKYLAIERHTGVKSTLAKAGFVEAIRRSKRRPIMWYFVEDQA